MDFVCFVCLQTRNPSAGLQKHENKRFFLKKWLAGCISRLSVCCNKYMFMCVRVCLCVCVPDINNGKKKRLLWLSSRAHSIMVESREVAGHIACAATQQRTRIPSFWFSPGPGPSSYYS